MNTKQQVTELSGTAPAPSTRTVTAQPGVQAIVALVIDTPSPELTVHPGTHPATADAVIERLRQESAGHVGVIVPGAWATDVDSVLGWAC